MFLFFFFYTKDDPISDRFPARMQIQIAETYLSVHPHPLHYAKADSTRATSARTSLPQPASMLCGDGNTWIGNVFLWQLEDQHFHSMQEIYGNLGTSIKPGELVPCRGGCSVLKYETYADICVELTYAPACECSCIANPPGPTLFPTLAVWNMFGGWMRSTNNKIT